MRIPDLFAVLSCLAAGLFPLLAGTAAAAPWQPQVVQVGDPQANYLNVEITADHRYMVWFEAAPGSATSGQMWHCLIDPDTGNLIPADCRGFRAFESTAWGRANPGHDALGPYYVGANSNGQLVMVRPRGATRGEVTVLPTPADPRRRAIYPTHLDSRPQGYVLFIQNERTPGAGVRQNGNQWVELQMIDLARPEAVRVIERQDTPARGFAPMDAGFVRWMRGRPLMTYGRHAAQTGKVETWGFDAEAPGRGAFPLVIDGTTKIDPYGAVLGSHEYLMAGIDATATSRIYRRPGERAASTPFELHQTLSPQGSLLAAPSLAQSHEPFLFRDRLYTVYQVNEQGQGFFDISFRQPGEIWLTDLTADPIRQWRIAPLDGGPVAEPEPVVTAGCVVVFYTRPVTDSGAGAAQSNERAQRPLLRRLTANKRPAAGAQLPRFALFRATTPLCPH